MQSNYICNSCDAEFKIKHDLDDSYYEVNFCPFCGAEIDDEVQDESDDFE